MKKLLLALVPAIIFALASPAHPAIKQHVGCINALRVNVDPPWYPVATVGNKTIWFGKNNIRLFHRTEVDPPPFTSADWAKWERLWDLLKRGSQAKVLATVFYDDTNNVVKAIEVAFAQPC